MCRLPTSTHAAHLIRVKLLSVYTFENEIIIETVNTLMNFEYINTDFCSRIYFVRHICSVSTSRYMREPLLWDERLDSWSVNVAAIWMNMKYAAKRVFNIFNRWNVVSNGISLQIERKIFVNCSLFFLFQCKNVWIIDYSMVNDFNFIPLLIAVCNWISLCSTFSSVFSL